jgi:hypothetical protein
METQRILTISLEKARELYKNGSEDMKSLLLESFSKEELEQPKLPKTWEEYCNNEYRTGYYINESSRIGFIDQGKYGTKLNSDFDKTVFKAEKDAYAHLALMQLHVLRDAYRDYYQKGWKPNWNDVNQMKFCIYYHKDEMIITTECFSQAFLSFPTKELAEQFLENFKDLIEQAKPLL